MEQRQLTCIGCPMGCPITVTMDKGAILSIEGFTCKRGETYARKEVTNPIHPHRHLHRPGGGGGRRRWCR